MNCSGTLNLRQVSNHWYDNWQGGGSVCLCLQFVYIQCQKIFCAVTLKTSTAQEKASELVVTFIKIRAEMCCDR